MRKLILLLFFFSSFSHGQTITKFNNELTNQKLNNVHFALPKTIVQLSISADKTIIKEPDDKEDLKQIFTELGFKMLPKRLTNSVKVKIEKVTAKTIAVPDEEHIYQIYTDKKFNRKSTIGLSVSNSGLITGASIESTNLTLKFITSLLVLSATVPVSAESLSGKTFDPEVHIDVLFDQLEQNHFLDNIGNTNGKELKKIIGEKKIIKDSLEKYDKILKRIENGIIFRNYYPLGLNETIYRIKRLEGKIIFWNAKLSKKKAEFEKAISKIMGSIEKRKESIIHNMPWKFPNPTNLELIKIVQKKKNSTSLELANLPEGLQFSSCLNCLKFNLKRTNTAIGSQISEKFEGTNYTGMPFKVPESYALIISSKDKELGVFEFIAAGKFGRLDESLKIDNVEYYEQLGWIKSFKSTNKTIETSEIDSLGSSLYSVVGKVNGKSELEILTEETTLLELQLKKLKAEAEIKGILNPEEIIIEDNEE